MAEVEPGPEYKCLLCLNQCKRPRKLTCHHTFCYTCLKEYIINEHVTTDENRLYFPCPVCDAPIAPSDTTQPVNTWALSFPINRLFIGSTSATSSDDKVCDACCRENEANPAEVFCFDCPDFLCKQCRIAHKKNRTSTKHVLVSATEVCSAIDLHDLSINGLCSNHDEKIIDVFCLDHKSLCCGVCVSLHHRHCNNIKSIKEVSSKAMAGKPHHEGEWGKIAEELSKMLNEDESEMVNLASEEKEISDKISQAVQRAKNKLDELNGLFQSDLRQKFNHCKQYLSIRQKHIKTFQANADNCRVLMSRLEKRGDLHNIFIAREQIKQQLLAHFQRVDHHTWRLPNSFEVTVNMPTVFDNMMELTSAADINMTSKTSQVSLDSRKCVNNMFEILLSTPSASSFACTVSGSDVEGSLHHLSVELIQEKLEVWKGSVSLMATVKSASLGQTEEICLSGGVFTDKGELIVTDFYNKRLIMFNDKYSYLDEHAVDGNPTDIALGHSDQDLFVAVVDNKIFRFTLRDGQLSTVNSFKSPMQTWGITVHGQNMCAGTDRSVDVMSVNGDMIRSFKKMGSFTYPTVSQAAVYHKDIDDIVCTQLEDGKEIARYRDPCLREPRGMGQDRDGNIYVCGLGSGNIFVLSPDLSRGREILPKLSDITKAYGIVVHPTKLEFVVTSLKESTSLEVYKINENDPM
ncbi:uncharacterized protein LOC132545372 [Ylistrum balloti]|uniref:uncharacterized protein LOC132545372 n=1 Tax=Ylistrum balloti TaxID=509963 RepID=UPI002905C254|nr:uncharacterized protein LOC132545372 [Ylistrum balloti]XP_060065036.1 uncharacterized protein LOC132545372 [Ylistrum balloti]